EKVRAVMEKRYIVNIEDASLHPEEWEKYSIDEKLNYYSYYQLAVFNQYQNYLQKIETQKTADQATLSMLDLQLNDTAFQEFQHESSALVMKYYIKTIETSSEDKQTRAIGVTIMPDA